MGYSCLAISGLVLDAMVQVMQDCGPHPDNISNGWTVDGNNYFYEVGREQQDGSITGSVWGPSKTEGCVHKVGSFKIDAEGKVVRFPTSSKVQRDKAQIVGHADYKSKFGAYVDELIGA
jgi:hypothetical protein